YNRLDLQPDQQVPAGDLVVPGGRRDDCVAEPVPTPQQDVASAASADVQALGSSEALAPVVKKPTSKPARCLSREYEVQKGDTLRSLALLFGVDIQTLLNSNHIDDPDLVTVGTKLTVLPVSGVQYEVQGGDTLADIAAGYEV